MPKGIVCLEFCFSRAIEFPTVITRKSPTDWRHIIDRRKAERVAYRNVIWYFWIFGQFETQKLSSVQSLFCPETEFSNEVDLRKFITSKPFSG
jgi:hypothetical protein